MNGLHVFTSNYLEVLAEQLARVVRKPLSDSFAPEVIVVQSGGMQRWVSMEIARHNGICANCQFPFPNRFLDDLFSRINPDLPETSPFEPGVMAFRIMQLLPQYIENTEFRSLKDYLDKDRNKLKLYQLSRKIADTFDQYLVFRPDMIFNWEGGQAAHWQAVLWRKLAAGGEARHRAALRNDLISWIRKQVPGIRNLPERLSVFGISYLPPFHLQTLAEISGRVPVYLFLMNPCREYWADIVSVKEMVRLRQKYTETRADGDIADLHLESGNRLLASLGTLGRDFFERISATDFTLAEHFRDPGRSTLLRSIQSELLNLTESSAPENSTPCAFASDRSVQVHSCHSPMREVEVLYDQLLDMLASEPGLMPKDIVVMTPDIEVYAPYIQAVFDVQDETGVRIPFTIADRNLKRESRAIEAFLSILDLKNSRYGAARVLSLLEFESVREKYGLSETDLETVLHWINETQIRWGRDGADRSKFGIEGFPENSWRQGLDRLLLGYAMPGNDTRMFKGILPYDAIEGGSSLILGRFLEFTGQLFHYVEMLDNNKKLSSWDLLYNALIDKFIQPSETVEGDIQILRKIFRELTEIETLSGNHDEVDFEIVRTMIDQRLEKENYGYGFISGGVTFCAMLPMRSIPFKVVCLIGMNSDSFPRENRPLGFDLIAKNPRPGDRSRRNDDKYLFLEALISAREKIYISYIGQNLQDNSQMPPSVLVSELMDYINSGFGLSEDQIVTRHPLQAFSPVYFDEKGRFFSYSEENLQGAILLVEKTEDRPEPSGFISGNLPIQPEDVDKWKQIDLKEFCEFWAHPSKFLLQRRLGVYLAEETALPEEHENFYVGPLERYVIGQRIVEEKLSGIQSSDLPALFRAQGRLPVGTAGRVVFHQMESEAKAYVDRSRIYMSGSFLEPLDVHIDLDGFRLTGRLEGICPTAGLVRFRYAKLQVKYLLSGWIHHLVYSLTRTERYPVGSFLVCKDAVWKFDPVSSCRQTLSRLVRFYWTGLSAAFHFFPETSFTYARQLLEKNKTRTAALAAARRVWTGSDFNRGEGEDPYINLLFRHIDPFDDRFHEAAISVFEPVFQYTREDQ
ncbi:MAG: exodeoxyribonuclease V subunit gamma [Thermodesulfobacteriota bacterium]